jgi:hypothetical protein
MGIEDCGLRIEEARKTVAWRDFLNPQFSILNPSAGGTR